MTAPPDMRDLARCLLAYEAVTGKTAEPVESATIRVYEKIRHSLVAFAGVASFQSLASRAMGLARLEAPSLSAAQVAADGYLQGMDDFEPQFDFDIDRGECGVIFIAHLLGLLLTLLGEALTLSLLRNAWPNATFDDRNPGNGRKA